MPEDPQAPVEMFSVTDQSVDAAQTPQDNGQPTESPPAEIQKTPTVPIEPQKSEAEIFFEKYGSQAETFEKYNGALDLLIKPQVNQILSDNRLTSILLGMDVPATPKEGIQQPQQAPSISSIEIPEFSDDDLSDPSLRKLAKGFQSMKQILEQQSTFIEQATADKAKQDQSTKAFNGQVLLASQMGASNPIEFVRAASTREWQQKVAEMQVQMWNAMNDKNAAPAPAPVANTQTQDILARLEKKPDVPLPGADGGGSGGDDPTKGFFKIVDTGAPMFPI